MSKDTNQDVVSIREWLAKETYLPQDFGVILAYGNDAPQRYIYRYDMMIKKFLHSCYGSLERTKKCIERFCTTRSVMSDTFTSRDPSSPRMKTAFSITTVSTYNAGENEIVIHQLNDPTLEKYDFYDVLKAFSLEADYWLKFYDCLPEGHIIIMDIKDYSLKILPKVNVMYYRDFLLFMLEGMPVRVKQVNVINCPPYYEKLYALVKPILPEEIRNIIQFHPTAEGLHKTIDKKYLPKEYGGDAPSMQQQHEDWVKTIQGIREMYLDDNMWKADLKRKPKSNDMENTMSGSFRTLSID